MGIALKDVYIERLVIYCVLTGAFTCFIFKKTRLYLLDLVIRMV